MHFYVHTTYYRKLHTLFSLEAIDTRYTIRKRKSSMHFIEWFLILKCIVCTKKEVHRLLYMCVSRLQRSNMGFCYTYKTGLWCS